MDAIQGTYEKDGFVVFTDLFSDLELDAIYQAILEHHHNWIIDNKSFYNSHAINSYNLTGFDYIGQTEKQRLFDFISLEKITDIVEKLIGKNAVFIGTQLFFDPFNPERKNYWHRDIQYSDLAIDVQKQALLTQNPFHFRIPLKDERGIELIPGSHRAWDRPKEYDVRLERHGHQNFEDLERGVQIPLSKGDMLVFNANMIHRGLYGNDRLTLDILFSDYFPDIEKFVQKDSLPKQSKDMAFPFKNALQLLPSKV